MNFKTLQWIRFTSVRLLPYYRLYNHRKQYIQKETYVKIFKEGSQKNTKSFQGIFIYCSYLVFFCGLWNFYFSACQKKTIQLSLFSY